MCRKKWKSLRDRYLKKKRKDTEKRSGSDQDETEAAGQSETEGVLTSEATQQCIYVVVFFIMKCLN